MSEDRIYGALMEIKEQLGGLGEAQKNTNEAIIKIETRLAAIECKPAKRMEGGITAAIATVVTIGVNALATVFIKK